VNSTRTQQGNSRARREERKGKRVFGGSQQTQRREEKSSENNKKTGGKEIEESQHSVSMLEETKKRLQGETRREGDATTGRKVAVGRRMNQYTRGRREGSSRGDSISPPSEPKEKRGREVERRTASNRPPEFREHQMGKITNNGTIWIENQRKKERDRTGSKLIRGSKATGVSKEEARWGIGWGRHFSDGQD